jgi:hypothetical protein
LVEVNRPSAAGANMNAEHHRELQQIRNGAEVFNVTVIESKQTPRRAVLFAVGRGGNP